MGLGSFVARSRPRPPTCGLLRVPLRAVTGHSRAKLLAIRTARGTVCAAPPYRLLNSHKMNETSRLSRMQVVRGR